jgi:hypothetical protein
VGVAYALYALAVVLTRPASGGLVDSVGRRRVLAVGGVALAAAMALLGFSTAALHVYAALYLAGVASSLVNVAVVAYVSDVGGLEDPALYSKMRIAAALGAVAGGVSIPAAYLLSGVASYAVGALAPASRRPCLSPWRFGRARRGTCPPATSGPTWPLRRA